MSKSSYQFIIEVVIKDDVLNIIILKCFLIICFILIHICVGKEQFKHLFMSSEQRVDFRAAALHQTAHVCLIVAAECVSVCYVIVNNSTLKYQHQAQSKPR